MTGLSCGVQVPGLPPVPPLLAQAEAMTVAAATRPRARARGRRDGMSDSFDDRNGPRADAVSGCPVNRMSFTMDPPTRYTKRRRGILGRRRSTGPPEMGDSQGSRDAASYIASADPS